MLDCFFFAVGGWSLAFCQRTYAMTHEISRGRLRRWSVFDWLFATVYHLFSSGFDLIRVDGFIFVDVCVRCSRFRLHDSYIQCTHLVYTYSVFFCVSCTVWFSYAVHRTVCCLDIKPLFLPICTSIPVFVLIIYPRETQIM